MWLLPRLPLNGARESNEGGRWSRGELKQSQNFSTVRSYGYNTVSQYLSEWGIFIYLFILLSLALGLRWLQKTDFVLQGFAIQPRAEERLAMWAPSAWKPQQEYKKSKLSSLETSHIITVISKHRGQDSFDQFYIPTQSVSAFELILSTPFIVKRILLLVLAMQMFSTTFI